MVERSDPDDPLSMDLLELRLALVEGTEADAPAALAEAVRQKTGVRPVPRAVPIAAIFDPERALKARRFVDNRKGGMP